MSCINKSAETASFVINLIFYKFFFFFVSELFVRFTLGTSGPAVAALVCAFYPRFPVSSTDNRYQLMTID